MTPGLPFAPLNDGIVHLLKRFRLNPAARAAQENEPTQKANFAIRKQPLQEGRLRISIFQGRVARADGIDILEKIRLIRIDAEIFAKFLVLGSR